MGRFRADIEGLRALSVLGVLAFHAGMPFATGGYVGVDVFFVISGFLITGLLLRDHTQAGAGRTLAEFYARRVRRILPAAAVVIVATLVGAALVQNGVENVRAADDARAVVFFFANNHFAQADSYFNELNRSVFQQYWSLSVEEQFYALWPLVFLGVGVVAGRHRHRAALAAVLGAVCIASLALSTTWAGNTTWLSQDPTYAFYLLPARAWELGIGALIAVGGRHVAIRLSPRRQRFMALGGLTAIAAAMVLFDATTRVPGWPALLPTLGAAAVIVAGLDRRTGGVTDAVLELPVTQAVGRYSYSLYLWHWPVLVLAQDALPGVSHERLVYGGLMIAVSVPAAILTYHFVENPIRHAPRLRVRPSQSLGFGAAVIATTLVAISAFTGASRESLRTHLTASAAAVDPTVVSPTDFVPDNLVPPLTDTLRDRFHLRQACPSPCVAGTSNAGFEVAMWGDSHAEHLAPALEEALRGMNVRATEHVLRGCSLFAPERSKAGRACPPFIQATLAKFRASQPDLIVLSSRSERVYRQNPAATEEALASTLRALVPIAPVVVVGETPFAPRDIALCLAENLRSTARCDQAWPTALNARLKPLVEAGQATFLDLRTVLCSATRCPAISGNRLIWHDRDHLTVEYSRALGPWLRQQLDAFLRPALNAPVVAGVTVHGVEPPAVASTDTAPKVTQPGVSVQPPTPTTPTTGKPPIEVTTPRDPARVRRGGVGP